MSIHSNVQTSAVDPGLARYLRQAWRFPMLKPQEEYMLAKRWREHGDRNAAHGLVTSHLRLVAKIAVGYRGYGLPISEVISEGNVGLMQAVKRFEPERGFRLATYAMWWIKAAIQEYILRSWSLVKMGTTANQKKLFFNLRKAKSRISAFGVVDQVGSVVSAFHAGDRVIVSCISSCGKCDYCRRGIYSHYYRGFDHGLRRLPVPTILTIRSAPLGPRS